MPDGTRSGGGVQNQNDQGQNVDDGGTDNDGQNVNRQPSERDPENSKGDVTQRSGVRDTPRQEGRPPPSNPSNPSNTGGPPINTGGPPVNNGGNIPRGNAFGVQNQMHPGQQMETLSGTLGGVIKTVGGVLDTTLEGVGRLLGGGNQLNPDTSSSRITPDDQGQNHQGPNGHNHGHPDTPRPIGAPAHSERTQPNLPGGPHNEGGPPSSNRANDGRPTTPMGGNEGASNPTSSRGGNVTELRTGQPQASPSSAQTSPSSQTSQPAQTQAQQATNRAAAPMAQPVPLSGFVGTGQAAGVLAQATAQGALPSSIPGQLANLAAGAAGLLGQQTAEARQASTTATPQQLPAQNENAARDLRNSPTQLPQAPADAKRPPDMPADKALTKTSNEAQTQQQARTQNDAQTRPQTDLRTVNQQRPADAQQTLRTEGDAKALREGLEKTKLVQSAETARTSPLGEDAKKAAQLATNATGRAAAGTVESLRQALDWVGQQVRGVGADPKTDSEGVTAMRVVAGLVIAATVVGVAIAVLYAIRIAFVP